MLGTERGRPAREILRDPEADVHVPALCDVEFTAGIRRALLHRSLSETRATDALIDYLDLPLTRHGHVRLVARILDLRKNFSAYDACYVALAEELSGELLTADEPLMHAVRAHTDIAIIE